MKRRKFNTTQHTLRQIEDKLKRISAVVEIARKGPVDKYQIQKVLAEKYQITVSAGTVNVDFAILLRGKVKIIEKFKGSNNLTQIKTVLKAKFDIDMLNDTVPRITLDKHDGLLYIAPKHVGLEHLFGFTDFVPPENGGRYIEERHPCAALIPFKNGVSGTSLSVESMSVVR